MYKILYFLSGNLRKSPPQQATHAFFLFLSETLLRTYTKSGLMTVQIPLKGLLHLLNGNFLAMEYRNLEW